MNQLFGKESIDLFSLDICPLFKFNWEVEVDNESHSDKHEYGASHKIWAFTIREFIFDFRVFAKFFDNIPKDTQSCQVANNCWKHANENEVKPKQEVSPCISLPWFREHVHQEYSWEYHLNYYLHWQFLPARSSVCW